MAARVIDDTVSVEAKDPLVFLSADYAFIAEVLGHQGASSKYRCVWCLTTDDEIQEKSCEAREAAGQMPCARNLASMHADYARYYKSAKKTAAVAQKCHNVVDAPLLEALKVEREREQVDDVLEK